MSRTVTSRAIAGGVLLLAVFGCDRGQAQGQGQTAKQPAQPSVIREQLGEVPKELETRTAEALSSTFRGAANRALPAVVFINVEKPASREDMQEIPEPFRRFFGPDGQGEDGEPQPMAGAGSGFIMDAEGHVITNNHVVEDATQVLVRLVDGHEYTAKVLGSDEMTDVAVLKIEPPKGTKLPVAQLGESASLQVGDWVLALGSPLELEFTVTAGIVSAKGRQLTGRQAALESYIQTDAAINPGNSGGPLVDLSGRVVGINTAIFGGPRFVGYGFAIPIDLAKKAVNDILQYGRVRRPQLGVSIQKITEADAEVYKLPEVRGAEVVSVSADSPAEKAGIQVGDVILAVEGAPIHDSTELTTMLAQHQPGDTVGLEVWRDGKGRTLNAKLGEFERPEDQPVEKTERHELEESLGFRAEPLTPQLARQLELEDVTTGIVITRVAPLSGAQNAGVRPGLILESINGQKVTSVADVQRIAKTVEPGSVVSLRVRAPQIGSTIINYRARR